MNLPLVSVLIPTHQRPVLLADAIASVAAQDYPADRIEIVVVHDGPTNAPAPDLHGLQGQYYVAPKAGLSASVNAAFARSHGHFVTVLADDDWIFPHKLTVLATALQAFPERVVYALGMHIAPNGERFVPPRSVRFLMEQPIVNWDTIVRRRGLRVHGTALMYRRAVWEEHGPWDESLPTAEEWEFHLRLLYQGERFRAVHSVTDAYRIHPSQKSARKLRRSQLKVDTLRRINDRYPIIAGKSILIPPAK